MISADDENETFNCPAEIEAVAVNNIPLTEMIPSVEKADAYFTQRPAVDYFMTYERFCRDHLDDNVFFVDLQFMDRRVSEIAMIGPSLPIIYHRSYNIRYALNHKTYRHNMNYTARGRNFISDVNLFNDDYVFKNIPRDSIFILRGRDKLRQMRLLINNQSLNIKFFTFPEKLMSSTNICPIHIDVGMCAVANVIKMAKYYNMYTDYYNK